jgi:GGDEF domain-containing protein
MLSHDVGDQVLVLVAKLLETELAAVAPEGFAARMGGEEFLMVLPGIDTPRRRCCSTTSAGPSAGTPGTTSPTGCRSP